MKRKILNIFFLGILCFSLVGCGKTEDMEYELSMIDNKIVEYFLSDNEELDNLSFNYIDRANNKVIVGLLDNSKEQQEKIEKFIGDTEFIEFVQSKKQIDDNDDSTLMDTYNKVSDYFGNENVDRHGLSTLSIDEKKSVVIVGLAENSKEEQEKFLNNVQVSSKYILFKQGGINELVNG